MRKLARILAGLLVPAFLVAGIVATPAMAQDKMAKKMEKAKAGEVVLKEIAANDKLRVYEATFKPGDTGANAKRPMRAVYAIKGGTLERTYEDGKKENIVWKTGESRIISEERPYALKNVGKTVVHLLVVQPK
jgi:hypothetical protein